MYPHRIRLRGPWQYTAATREGTVTMPGRLRDFGLDAERVSFRRRFGHPRQLDDFERVWLVCDGIDGSARFRLNEQELGTFTTAFSHEIPSILRQRNLLEVELTATNDAAGLWAEVALEIRRTAWLTNLTKRVEGDRIHVSGEVTGTCDGPLDLYLLCAGATVHHQMIKPGESFDVSATHPQTRIELIQGATVWYAADV